MAAPTIVQQVFNSGTASNAPTATFSATPTVGNRIVAIIATNGTSGVNVPTGWNYKKSNSAAGSFMAATQGVSSSPATTYTFALPGNSSWIVHLLEIAGAVGNSFVDSSVGFASATSSYNAGNLTPNMYPVLSLGYFMPLTANITVPTGPSGWTANGSATVTGLTLLAYTETLSSGNGVMSATLSASSTGYGFQVGFSAPPSAGPWVNQVGSNTGTNATPDANLAEATIAGNTLVCVLATLGTPIAASGWTLLQTYSYGGITFAVYSKVTAGVAGGYEYPATLSASASWICVIYELENVNTTPLAGSADYGHSYSATVTVTWSPSYTPPANCLGLWVACNASTTEPSALASPANFNVTDENGSISGIAARFQHNVVASTASAVTPTFTQTYSGSGSIANLSALFYIASPPTSTTIMLTATSAGTGGFVATAQAATNIVSTVTEPMQVTTRAALVGISAASQRVTALIAAALGATSASSERLAARTSTVFHGSSVEAETVVIKLEPSHLNATTIGTEVPHYRVAAALRATSTSLERPFFRIGASARATTTTTGVARARTTMSTNGLTSVGETATHAAGLLLIASSIALARLSARLTANLLAVSVASDSVRAHIASPLQATSTVAHRISGRISASVRSMSTLLCSATVLARPFARAITSLTAKTVTRVSPTARAVSVVSGRIGFHFSATLASLVSPSGHLSSARIRAPLSSNAVLTVATVVSRALLLVAHTVITMRFTYVEIVRKLRAILADLFATVAALGELEVDLSAIADLFVAEKALNTMIGDAEFLPIVDDGGTVPTNEILEQSLDMDGTLMDDLEADVTLADMLDAAPPILP